MQVLKKTMTPSRRILLALLLLAVPASSFAGVEISITIAPPVMPVYVQPECPADGYIWTPGYWAYGPEGYYWVPGVWVTPPRMGVLWTPGYWGWGDGVYRWHGGYWGPHVGFYGGVNYGFGYTGVGFIGGVWAGNVFRYNTAVMNVNRTVVRNVYVDRTVIRNTTIVNNRASFNGPGGIAARPTPEQMAAGHEQHFQATSTQLSHQQVASQNRAQFASVNHGNPGIAAMDAPNGRQFGAQGHALAGPGAVRPQGNRPQGTQYPGGAAGARQGYPQGGQANRPQGTQYPGGATGARQAAPQGGQANRPQGTQYPGGGAGAPQQSVNRPQGTQAPQQNATRPAAGERPANARPEQKAAPQNRRENKKDEKRER
jgi:hypothetical protein